MREEECTYSELVYSSATVPSNFTSSLHTRSKLPPNLIVDCDIRNSLTLIWIIFFALSTEFYTSSTPYTLTWRIEMTGDSIISPNSSLRGCKRPFRILIPRDNGPGGVSNFNFNSEVYRTAVRWTVRPAREVSGKKTGVPAVDLRSRLSRDRYVF